MKTLITYIALALGFYACVFNNCVDMLGMANIYLTSAFLGLSEMAR